MRQVREIEADRLKLRRLCVADGARIAQLSSDPAVARMTARIPLPHPVVAAEGFVLIMRAREPLGLDHVFAIELRDEGLIGLVGAHAGQHGGFEIGYWLGRTYWGVGYASEALAAFLSEAGELGPLGAGHFEDNPASGRVLEKAGFRYTGETVPQFSMARGHSVMSRRMALKQARARACCAA